MATASRDGTGSAAKGRGEVRLAEVGQARQEGYFSYYVTYAGDTLSSLNILDALGTYDFTNLTVFNWAVDDGRFNAVGIDFTQMIIIPEPASWGLLALGGFTPVCRRR
jgi:hypothetical protein